jgi:hypothetical protein
VSSCRPTKSADDVPSRAHGERPLTDERGRDFAKRLLDDKYGEEEGIFKIIWPNRPLHPTAAPLSASRGIQSVQGLRLLSVVVRRRRAHRG